MLDKNLAALRQRIKMALLREACHRKMLTEAQLYTLLQGQQTQ